MTTTKVVSRQDRKQQRAAQHRKAQFQTIAVVGGFIIVLAVILVLSLSAPNAVLHAAQIGQPISAFSLSDINGVTHNISDYAGRPVLINGWATWCPPCKAEMPALHAFYLKHKAEGFELLAINSGESQPAAASFIHDVGFTFPVLIDPGKQVLDGLGINGLPTSILVGRDGRVKYIHIGGLTPAVIEKEIAPMLVQ